MAFAIFYLLRHLYTRTGISQIIFKSSEMNFMASQFKPKRSRDKENLDGFYGLPFCSSRIMFIPKDLQESFSRQKFHSYPLQDHDPYHLPVTRDVSLC